MNPGSAWTDEKTEKIIGNLLRAGVLTAAAIVLTGGGLYLAHHGHARPDYHIFRSEPPELRSISGVSHSVMKLEGRAIIQLGLMLLILTPIARVMFSAVAFAMEKDKTYVVVTLIVLAVLLYSVLGTR